MLHHAAVFLLGLATLVAGARLLVRGASRLALSLGVSPLVIGLTVVAMGTSAPELAVGIGAAAAERTDMAVGNVLGSNIFNVLFILGLSALITPLAVDAQVIRQEVPIMIGASLLLVVLALDGRLGGADSTLLLILLAVYTVFLIVQSRRQTQVTRDEYAKALPPARGWDRHWSMQAILLLGGLALLVLGSDWLVDSAVALARAFGLSELIIALTIVAAGTSMPEVATSVAAALQGERDIAVGNVVGSNIFNLLGCLGAAGLVAPGGLPVPPAALAFDLWIMLAVSFACLPVFLTGREIARWEGALFLGYYLAYTVFLVLAARHHQALPQFSTLMMSFVVPLTIVTLLVSLLHGVRRRGGR